METHLDPVLANSSFADIDECMVNMDNCADNAVCMDTDGSYTCTCNPGYTGDGVMCSGRSNVCAQKNVSLKQCHECALRLIIHSCTTDNDECTGANDCDPNADCENTPGSYTCSCQDGYSGDGYGCQGSLSVLNKCCAFHGCCAGIG